MAEPAQAQAIDRLDLGHRRRDRLDLLDELGLDRVHQPPEHLAGRLLEDDEDDRGDEQPDERVGERVAGRDAERAGDDGQRGQPVGPGVVAVGDERGRADRAADPDAVEGDEPRCRRSR